MERGLPILILLFVIPSLSYSQSASRDLSRADDLFNMALDLQDKDNYDSCHVLLEEARDLFKKHNDLEMYFSCQVEIGYNLYHQYRESEVYQHQLTVHEELEKTDEELTLLRAENYYLLLISYQYDTMGNGTNAARYFEVALETSINEEGETSEYVEYISTRLAYIYNRLKQPEKAKVHLQRSLKAVEAYEDKTDQAKMYADLATTYFFMGEFRKSLDLYIKTYNTWLEADPDNLMDLGTSMNMIGQCYDRLGNYDKGMESYQKSLEIHMKRVGGEIDLEVAGENQNIAGMYEAKGDYKNALKYYRIALRIQLITQGEMDFEVANTYHNIGLVMEDIGNYEEALKHFEKAASIYKELLESLRMNVPILLGELPESTWREKSMIRPLSYIKRP